MLPVPAPAQFRLLASKSDEAREPSAVNAAIQPGDHRVLLVRLPCNPIFPVGPIYLADHLHKQFPQMAQQILDLAAVPVLDVERVLDLAESRQDRYALQALVSEPVKPIMPCVVMSNTIHAYMSQSDKGGLVFGGDIDMYSSYASRGNLPMVEHVMEAGMTLMPMLARARVRAAKGSDPDMRDPSLRPADQTRRRQRRACGADTQQTEPLGERSAVGHRRLAFHDRHRRARPFRPVACSAMAAATFGCACPVFTTPIPEV